MSARPHTPPRRIFRSRRGRTLVITDQPGAAYHAKVIKAGLKLAPGAGTVQVAEVWHHARCPLPRDEGPCTCQADDIDVVMKPFPDPERN